jgi:hypothetical protein
VTIDREYHIISSNFKIAILQDFPEQGSQIYICFHEARTAKAIQKVNWAMSIHNNLSMLSVCEQLITILIVIQHHCCCAQLAAKPRKF